MCRRFETLFIDGVSKKNNRDEITGVFIQEKFWFKNSLWQSEGEGACPIRETGCGGQRPPSGGLQ